MLSGVGRGDLMAEVEDTNAGPGRTGAHHGARGSGPTSRTMNASSFYKVAVRVPAEAVGIVVAALGPRAPSEKRPKKRGLRATSVARATGLWEGSPPGTKSAVPPGLALRLTAWARCEMIFVRWSGNRSTDTHRG